MTGAYDKSGRLLVIGALLYGLGLPLMAQQDSSGLFRLSIEDLLNLSVEVSTALKSASRTDEAPASVHVITREEMDNMGLMTLGEALNHVPGFTVGKSIQGGQQKNVYVRGEFSSFSEGILVLYNGQRLNDGITGGAFVFTADYTLDNIKQIEVVRGPVSSLYGANAFVAVVNLIPYRADEAVPSIVSLQAGNSKSLAVQGRHRLDLTGGVDVSVFGSLRKIDAHLPQRATHQSLFDSSSGTMVPRVFSDRVNLEKTDLFHVGTSVSWKKFEVDAAYSASENRNHWGVGAARRQDSLQNIHDNANLRLGAKYASRFMTSNRVTVLAGYSNHRSENVYRIENFRSVLVTGFDPPGHLSILESDLATSTINLESFAEINWSSDHHTVAGGNLQTDFIDQIDHSTAVLDVDGDGIFDSFTADDTLDTIFDSEKRTVYAAFVQHTWSPWQMLHVTGGARFDHYSDFGGSLNPRLTFVFHPWTKWFLKGMYGRAFRAPTFFETHQSDFTSIGGNRLSENPDLKPETIETFEMQSIFTPDERLSVSVNVFYNDIQHVIRPVTVGPGGVPTQTRWENSGSRDWLGVEVGARFSVRKHFSLFANYSYTQTADEKSGNAEEPVYGIPTHALNVAVNLSHRNVNLNVHSNTRLAWNDVPEFSNANMVLTRIDLASYTVVNARLQIKDVWRSMTLTVDARNILDQRYYFNDDRIFVPQGIAGDPRRIEVGVRYAF